MPAKENGYVQLFSSAKPPPVLTLRAARSDSKLLGHLFRTRTIGTMPRINWLAVFAIVLASYGIWSSRASAFETDWWLAAVAGLMITVAWLRDRSIGVRLAAASAVLGGVLLLMSGEPSVGARAVAAGASAGVLVGLAGGALVALARRRGGVGR